MLVRVQGAPSVAIKHHVNLASMPPALVCGQEAYPSTNVPHKVLFPLWSSVVMDTSDRLWEKLC